MSKETQVRNMRTLVGIIVQARDEEEARNEADDFIGRYLFEDSDGYSDSWALLTTPEDAQSWDLVPEAATPQPISSAIAQAIIKDLRAQTQAERLDAARTVVKEAALGPDELLRTLVNVDASELRVAFAALGYGPHHTTHLFGQEEGLDIDVPVQDYAAYTDPPAWLVLASVHY